MPLCIFNIPSSPPETLGSHHGYTTTPSTHLFWLNRRHAVHHTPPARRSFRAHHRQAPFLFRGTPPCTRNRLPAKAHSDRFLRRLRRSRRVPVGGCPFPGPLTAAVTPPSAKAARSQRPPRYTYEGKGQRSVPTRHLHRRVPHPVRGADRCGSTGRSRRTAGGGAFRRDRAGRAAGVEQRRSGRIGNNAV